MAHQGKRSAEENCKVVTDVLAQVVRFSLNERFRKRCFAGLQVEGSFDFQNEMNRKLLESLNSVTFFKPQSSVGSSQTAQVPMLASAAPMATLTQQNKASSPVATPILNIEHTPLPSNTSTLSQEERIKFEQDLAWGEDNECETKPKKTKVCEISSEEQTQPLSTNIDTWSQEEITDFEMDLAWGEETEELSVKK